MTDGALTETLTAALTTGLLSFLVGVFAGVFGLGLLDLVGVVLTGIEAS